MFYILHIELTLMKIEKANTIHRDHLKKIDRNITT